jgi:hypothetical protein
MRSGGIAWCAALAFVPALALVSAPVFVSAGVAFGAPPVPESERIGRRLAEAVIDSARAYAQEGRRDLVACDASGAYGGGSPGGAEAGREAIPTGTGPICAAENAIVAARRQAALLRDEERRAGVEDTGGTEAACFNWLIDKGLDSRQSIVRLHVLMRMFELCDQPDFMSEEGRRRCADYVEKGCLVILHRDSNGLNRQVALEILGGGYASDASTVVLEDLATRPARGGGTCRKAFSEATETPGTVSLDALNREYGNGRSPCEVGMSRELLKSLQKQRNEARSGQ